MANEQRKRDGKVVFLNSEDGVLYTKSWGGLDFSIEKLEDGSIKVQAPETDVLYLTERENDRGSYFCGTLYGGTVFVSFRDSDRVPGTDFAILKFMEECQLPPPPGGFAGKKEKEAPQKGSTRGWGNKAAKASPAKGAPKTGGYKKSWK